MLRELYSTAAWARTRAARLELDGHTCTVHKLGPEEGSALPCEGALTVAHIESVEEILYAGRNPFDVDETFTACARHHGIYDSNRRRRLVARIRELAVVAA